MGCPHRILTTVPTITRLPLLPFRQLRAEPNQLILHFRGGKVRRQGAGIAFWFSTMSAAIAMLPVEDCVTTFVLNERSADFQAVKLQCTLTYRVHDPERAATRFNFSISIDSGAWLEKPLDRLAAVMAQQVLPVARQYIARQPLETVLRDGSEQIRQSVVQRLGADAELAAMGLQLVGLVIDQIVPTAELEKALGTPMREAVQARADEAQFQRRALAVEKERAIKENELQTELELERRQQELIERRADNDLLKVRGQAQSAELEQQAALARALAAMQARAERMALNAQAKAAAKAQLDAQALDTQRAEHRIWADTPASTALHLVLSRLAGQLPAIGHLNITPELLGQQFTQYLRDLPVQGPAGSAD